MKLSWKMILLFSVMMALALTMLSSYAARSMINGADAFSSSRFLNMGMAMVSAVEQRFAMMDLAAKELTDNTSFMAAINQFVRDDSEEQKMAQASRNSVHQILERSPLLSSFYRVTFYTDEGRFITSQTQKEETLISGAPQTRAVFGSLIWNAKADAKPDQRLILPLHADELSTRKDARVYGLVRAVTYHGRQLGYLEITNDEEDLNQILGMVDEPTIFVHLVFDDGVMTNVSQEKNTSPYPADLPVGELQHYIDPESGERQNVMRVRSEALGFNLFLTQDLSILENNQGYVRMAIVKRALLIAVPTLLFIVLVSLNLTRSTWLLTKKVRQLSVENVLKNEPQAVQALSDTVTSPRDAEVHELESVFNDVMLRLRDSAINNLTLREGTLQAQMNALQTQINPHFIYNTLNIISAKSMESGNLDVIEICDQFAQLLRYSTDTRSKTATMAEEIDNVRNYLLLAKARFEDNLEFSIHIPENLASIVVPKLTLQPIVENALNHGFDGRNVKRCLRVTGQIENDTLILEIRDNGTGFPPDMLNALQERIQSIEAGTFSIDETGGHIGLTNTCLRLHYYSHGRMHVSIRNENGAVVKLTMPC